MAKLLEFNSMAMDKSDMGLNLFWPVYMGKPNALNFMWRRQWKCYNT